MSQLALPLTRPAAPKEPNAWPYPPGWSPAELPADVAALVEADPVRARVGAALGKRRGIAHIRRQWGEAASDPRARPLPPPATERALPERDRRQAYSAEHRAFWRWIGSRPAAVAEPNNEEK